MTTTESDQTPRDRKERLVRRVYTEAYNQGEYAILDELFASDYGGLGNATFDGEQTGPELARMGIDRFREAFPDIEFDIQGVYVDGDTAISHLYATGTHDGAWVIGPDDDPFVAEPSGTEFELRGMRLYRFEDGKVVESHAYSDEFEVAIALGFAGDFAEYITSQGDQE